ncbi:MAG: type II toxin-antitoxin system VapC family toxin [Cephaloticoccus sp.]|nr:type II toxin-antitoxin system VapC family toxin [Cephaloticoccus sp.]
MIYLDTSYLVRLYLEDPGYAEVRELAASDHVACATLGQSETVAAFHRKLREGSLSTKSYRAVLAQFEADLTAGAIQWLPPGPAILTVIRETYAKLPATVYLRGADAMHLATAAANGFKAVYSNDRHLLAAAPHFKLKAVNIL